MVKLYNTLTRQLEPVTSEDGVFRMYVCGITPYDTTHLGHAFTFIAFDVLERYLEFCGYRTITVQNVTDIDDDILRRARQVGIPWRQLAEQETQKYLDDMQSLNVRRPDHFPRATEQIEQIQTMVADLLAKGCAYERNGSVYYHVRRDPDFGQLAKWATPRCWQRPTSAATIPTIQTRMTRSTSCCGRLRSPTSRPGTAPGGRAGPAGISSARP